MSLTTQISALIEKFDQNAPDVIKEPIVKAMKDFEATYQPESAIQIGQQLPEFSLVDSFNKKVTSSELLKNGPLLLTFYRGGWCPICNLEVVALQKHLDDFKAKGVTLVAITPELPDSSVSTIEKNSLQFPVLSDVGNQYARTLGLLYTQPEFIRGTFEKLGHDLKKRNGDDSLELPIPATILVDRNGTVRNTFVDANYRKRLEPTVALEWIDAMVA